MNLSPVSLIPLAVLVAAAPQCQPDPVDGDQDGYAVDVDCDDADATVHPGAPEVCDGLDQDCDGLVDEAGCDAGLVLFDRDSRVEIRGQDNGRAEPNTYSEVVETQGFEPFDEAIGGQLEYVASTAAQVSDLTSAEIFAQGSARTSGADDYGYGQGAADAATAFTARFSLDGPAWVTVEAHTSTSRWDGGSAAVDVSLTLGDTVVFGLPSAGDSAERLLLQPGEYSLSASATTHVGMSGGGDAYPSGAATFSALLSFE